MNVASYWMPVALSSELTKSVKRGKPLSQSLHGNAIVLFRDAAGSARGALDYCPHRLMPLSAGRVCDGELECAYHGWRFSGEGNCTAVPGMMLPPQTKPTAPVIAVCEEGELIWVRLDRDSRYSTLALPTDSTTPLDTFFMTSRIKSSLDNAAENFLDGFHTHFVHTGWIRSNTKRQTIRAKVRRLSDGIEARYEGEGKQSGLISQLLESKRAWSAGRFRIPCLAEVEYHGDKGLSVLVSAWLVPETPNSIRVIARVATPKRRAPAWSKKLLLRFLFGVILKQDKRVVEMQQKNRDRYPEISYLNTPLDLLGPSIRKLLRNESLPDDVERDVVVEL